MQTTLARDSGDEGGGQKQNESILHMRNLLPFVQMEAPPDLLLLGRVAEELDASPIVTYLATPVFYLIGLGPLD